MNFTDADRLGGISTLDSAESRRSLDRMNAEDDERRQAVELLLAAYRAAVLHGDMESLALFSPRKTFRSSYRDGPVTPNVGEIIHDSLDAKDFLPRAMSILVNAAAGKATQRDAQMLLDEAGKHWADSESDFV
jgi:hypothetical protein